MFIFLFILDKPQKSFDDLFGETNTKRKVISDNSGDDFKMSNDSDDDFVPKSGTLK